MLLVVYSPTTFSDKTESKDDPAKEIPCVDAKLWHPVPREVVVDLLTSFRFGNSSSLMTSRLRLKLGLAVVICCCEQKNKKSQGTLK